MVKVTDEAAGRGSFAWGRFLVVGRCLGSLRSPLNARCNKRSTLSTLAKIVFWLRLEESVALQSPPKKHDLRKTDRLPTCATVLESFFMFATPHSSLFITVTNITTI